MGVLNGCFARRRVICRRRRDDEYGLARTSLMQRFAVVYPVSLDAVKGFENQFEYHLVLKEG